MFVQLINGPEPFIVNVDQVVAIEGIEGGRASSLILTNGGVRRVPMPAAAVATMFMSAKRDDWLEGGDPAAPQTTRSKR